MSRAVDDATTRARLLLTGLLVVALATLVPTLQAAAGDPAPTAVALAVLAPTLAAIARLGTGLGALAARPLALAQTTGSEAPPVLSGRVTDPVHHPLRPRAPGSA